MNSVDSLTCASTHGRSFGAMPIMSQMTRTGSCAATAATKSAGRVAITSSTISRAATPMSSTIVATRRGVNALETIVRSEVCAVPSMLTMESPNTARTQPGGSGVVTAGSLENSVAFLLAATRSACRTSA